VAVLVVGPAHPDSHASRRVPAAPLAEGSGERERRREHEREIRAARLHLAAFSRIGALITGGAVIVAAVLVIALIIAAR